jgi:diguanylate cyclase (GGDEF)-like protein
MPSMDASPHSFESQSYRKLRLVSTLSQAVGTLLCLAVLVVWRLYHPLPAWLYAGVALSALCAWVMYRSTNLHSLWLASLVAVLACVASLGYLAQTSENPLLWFIPIGFAFTLPCAAMYHYTRHFAITASLVWAVLYAVMQPHFAPGLDSLVVWMTVLGSMSVGVLVSASFHRIRRANFDLQQKLYAIAHVDNLTGLPNRRAFMDSLARAAQSAQARGHALYFLMLDIDDFKKINDSFGHDVGDEALVEVANVLAAQASSHCFGRLGGEEFAVAALVDEAEARALAQHIVAAVHACCVHGRHMSISIGLALHQEAESLTSLMRRADEALYQAKNAGKNRYVLAV